MRGRERAARGHALLALAALAAVSGCTASAEPGLHVRAGWHPWSPDGPVHLLVDLRFDGEGSAEVGPGAQPLNVTGPEGAVPVLWDDQGDRAVVPGREVVLALHPRSDSLAGFSLSLTHDWGSSASPPEGFYTVCIGARCDEAKV